VSAVVSALNAEARRLVGTDADWKVAGRVFGTELPKAEIDAGPRSCIVVQSAGGGGVGRGARSYLPWRVIRVNIRSYAETPDDADALDYRVYDYMTGFHGLVYMNHQTILRDAVMSGGPLPQRDPDIRWPFVLSVYDVSASPTE